MKFISTILLLAILAISASFASATSRIEANGIECELCQFVVKTAEDYLANNKTQQQVETELELACKILPSEWSSACDTFVESYAPLIINLLVNKEDPDTLCAQIKMCTSNLRRQHPSMRNNKKMIRIVQKSPEMEGNIECTLCGYVVSRIEAYVTANATESQIVSILDNDCKILKASTWVTTCQTIVNQYTPMIINYLEKKEPPQTICSQIGICPSGSGSGEEEAIPAQPKVSGGLECPICTFIATYAEKFVASNKSETELITFLQHECSKFEKYASACSAMVNNYVPEIITYIENGLTPAQICQKLGICTSTKKTVKRPALPDLKQVGDLQCVFCDYVVTYAESLLSNNATDQEVLQTLQNDCQLFGNQEWVQQCTNIVQNYGEKLISFILNNPNPQTACQAIGLCSGSSSDNAEQFESSKKASISLQF